MDMTRRAGVLMHPTSLPGPGGIGCLGPEARSFADFMVVCGFSVWQVLPLGPTGYGHSPYSTHSAFAGNPLMVDLRPLVEAGWLSAEEAHFDTSLPVVDFLGASSHKFPCLRKASARFFAATDNAGKADFWHFCDTTPWLHDYALFMALKEHFGGKPWTAWPADIALRTPKAVEAFSCSLGVAIGEHKFMQWLFSRQWQTLREYCRDLGIRFFGDIPIFVAHDSADVWVERHLFRLDAEGKPTVQAGVPPDYFSRTGQLWGNPLYEWDQHPKDGYGWWGRRIRSSLLLYDQLRIDHFRGFESCWQVPAGERTAVRGQWVPSPGRELFASLRQELGSLPLVAEDLGVITPEVEALRDEFGLPGMKILQFAFGSGPKNAYLPHNHRRNSVVYTGTHDNNTTVGWFASLGAKERSFALSYLCASPEEMPWPLIRAALASTARLAVIPLQDILELGSEARMNCPGEPGGNWSWRCPPRALTQARARRVKTLVQMYGRIDT